jgi:hypothetical protein
MLFPGFRPAASTLGYLMPSLRDSGLVGLTMEANRPRLHRGAERSRESRTKREDTSQCRRALDALEFGDAGVRAKNHDAEPKGKKRELRCQHYRSGEP